MPGINIQRVVKQYDSLLVAKDSAAVIATGAAQVAGAAKILDLGNGYVAGDVIVDVTALDNTSGDEKYEIEVQLSNTADFSAGVVVRDDLKLGPAAQTGNSAATVIGRFAIPFSTEYEGTIYRYFRLFNRVAGTTPSITYSAYLSKRFPTA